MENIENAKFREEEQFLENTKMVFSVFFKTFFKNSFQKQEPNMSLDSLPAPHHKIDAW